MKIANARLREFGVSTNWQIVGLSPRNTVLIEVDGEPRDSNEGPSAWIGLDHLMPSEIATLRRGLTRSGNDRPRPLPKKGN